MIEKKDICPDALVEKYAPAGKVWFCMMCGKTTNNCYGDERGWDESCVMNCILVDEATKQPTEAEAKEFALEHKRSLAKFKSDISELIRKLRDGDVSDIDPEMLELSQQAVDAMERRKAEAKATKNSP